MTDNRFSRITLGAVLAGLLLLPAAPARGDNAFQKAIRLALPSVVRIETETRSIFTRRLRGMVASGVVLTSDGYIVTCASVLGRSPRLSVHLSSGDKLPARIVRTDAKADLALLKVDRTGLAAIRFRTGEPPNVGHWVIAIGNPFGLAQTRTDPLSASIGVVSALRPIKARTFSYDDPVILTDISINPGASGGAVVDLEGRLVGVAGRVVTSSRTNTELSFAVPASVVKDLLNKAREAAPPPETNGRTGYLGAYILDETESTKGAWIQRVVPGSPADKAGLSETDLVTALDGVAVTNGRRLIEQLEQKAVGTRIEMTVLRDKAEVKITVTLGRPARAVLK